MSVEINDVQFGAMVEEALQVVATTYNCTFKIIGKKGKGGPPFAVFLNRNAAGTERPKGEGSCYLHNISRGVTALCGNALDKILLVCAKTWLEDGVDRINIANAVLSSRFSSQLRLSGEEYDKKTFEFLVNQALVITDSSSPTDVLAMAHALPLMKVSTFRDIKTIDAIFQRIDQFGDIVAMVREMNARGFEFEVVEASPTQRRYGKTINQIVLNRRNHQEPSAELIAIAEKLGVSPQAVEKLCVLVANVGTPLFIKRYRKYIEDEKAKAVTLASPDDIATLIGSISFVHNS